MRIDQTMTVSWELDDTHPIVQTFTAMSEKEQTELLTALVKRVAVAANERGTWARFFINPSN